MWHFDSGTFLVQMAWEGSCVSVGAEWPGITR